MAKNYTIFLVLFAIVYSPFYVASQEFKVFTKNDFDLKGPVKSCLVITNYGQEEFDFDEDGFLTKSVTRYNETDYDVTYYKYNGSEIKEKRVENYREGTFNKTTSFANFYSVDTTSGKKVTEKIVSYSKEFLAQNEYVYDSIGRLAHIKHADREGIDEIALEYADYKGESTVTYLLDGVVQKSIRTSQKKGKSNADQRIELTKEFLNGEPNKALEQVYDGENRLISKTSFSYTKEKNEFTPEVAMSYLYNDLGMLVEMKINTQKNEDLKKYIYQYDDGEMGNWIKQIVTPDNTYTTRRITYYPMAKN